LLRDLMMVGSFNPRKLDSLSRVAITFSCARASAYVLADCADARVSRLSVALFICARRASRFTAASYFSPVRADLAARDAQLSCAWWVRLIAATADLLTEVQQV